MTTPELGRLTEVDPREAWVHEASAFTPWLAQEENLRLLSDEIGLDLELEAQEQFVGSFRADILCRATGLAEHLVLIENQLERTDHGHLGQLLTYAAGLDAVTIVWIAKRFTDEHRAALDWLNDITDERVQFFGLEIKLFRIGSSLMAPKFEVVSKPNDWTKSAHAAARATTKGELTQTQEMQLRFWNKLRDLLIAEPCCVRPVSPQPNNWVNFSVGKSGYNLCAAMNTQKKYFYVVFICQPPMTWERHDALKAQKEDIERELGFELQWPVSRESKQAWIETDLYQDPTDESKWDEQVRWLRDRLESMRRVFEPRIKALEIGFPSDATEIGEVEG